MGVNVNALVAHPFRYDIAAMLLALDGSWFQGAWRLETAADRETLDEGLCTIIGPDRLMAWATPHILTIGAATRWRWFLMDAEARNATHLSFLKVAVALRSEHLVIVPDWALHQEVLDPVSTTAGDMIEYLRSTIGSEQLSVEVVSPNLSAEAEHASPAAWFVERLNAR